MAVKGRSQPTQKERRAEKKRMTEARATPLIECGICLEGIQKHEHFKLPCAQVYHEKCLFTWGCKNTPSGIIDGITPFGRSRKIILYREGTNLFTCPTCRIEYTHDIFDNMHINKVLAKIHSTCKGVPVVQYITVPTQIIAYVPYSGLDEKENRICNKWAIQLALLKKAWERGDTNIYPAMRLAPEPEFVLTNDHFNLCPLNKDGTQKPINHGDKITYRLVSVEEMITVLND